MTTSNSKDIKVLLTLVLLLTSIGIFFLYSASSSIGVIKYNNYQHFFSRQFFRIIIGIFTLYIACHIDYKIYKKYAVHIILSAWIIAILNYFKTPDDFATARAFMIYGKTLFTVSDLARFSLIIYISYYISSYKNKINSIPHILRYCLSIAAITLLMILKLPDLSSTFITALIIGSMLFISGLRVKYIATVLFCVLSCLIISIANNEYQQNRITNYLTMLKGDYSNANQQDLHSVYAFANGGIIGQGPGNSILKQGFLPESHTDFILPIIGEEFGFIGIIFVFFIFLLTFFFLLKIIQNTRDTFGIFLGIGISLNMIFYLLINAGYSVGILPTTGLPIPFISYGGSHIVFTLFSIGVMINISLNNSYNDTNIYRILNNE